MSKSSQSELARELFTSLSRDLVDLISHIDSLIARHTLLSAHLIPLRFDVAAKVEMVRDEVFALTYEELLEFDSPAVSNEEPSSPLANLSDPLTRTEVSVLEDLVKGLTTKEIALVRHNSEATIKSHLTAIYRKLGVRNRVEAVTWAVQGER